MKRTDILEIYPNGDPFGRGFQGSLSTDAGASWVFLGSIGAMPRAWWRSYARRNGYALRNRC
jgi:hypothetical protein